MNISLVLQMAAEAEPERVGLVCGGRRWPYRALLRAARAAAADISISGCAHVALLDESSEAAAIALFGAGLAGVPYVPLNYRLADPDLGSLLRRIAPAYIVGDAQRIERLSADLGHRIRSRSDFLAAATTSETLASADEATEGVAVQLFTSGTTDRKSTRLNSSHPLKSRMPSSA